jgi:hypothetical protein
MLDNMYIKNDKRHQLSPTILIACDIIDKTSHDTHTFSQLIQ